MSKTLLEIVQDCLSICDSDTVDSIGDTWEATQIATLVKNEYEDFITEYNLPTLKKFSFLEGVGDTARPNLLKLPSNIKNVLWWKYDCRLDTADKKLYTNVVYLEPYDFVSRLNSLDSLDTTNNQVVVFDSEISLVIRKDKAPSFWTSFDNIYVVTDSYDAGVDATLQQSKTQAFVEYAPTFTIADTTVPELPNNLEALFYRTCENTVYTIFKQQVNPKLEMKERRLRIRAQRNKHKLDADQPNFKETVDYGR